ncbi:MAG TPA: DUF4197 domain-containing protein [Alphaproteobacteria bacterium]|nr:DUF4197 domain-containing protein [Alphaproteobacteria bacterium]
MIASRRSLLLGLSASFIAAPALAQGNLLDQGRNLLGGGTAGSGSPGAGANNLSPQQADSGLREALRVASQRTVTQLGKPGGYLNDPQVRIPLPSYLESARNLLAKAGMAGELDDLQTRMNRAAETAAPKALDIFGKAIASMTVTDARGIVSGPQDAATQYFKRTTTQPLSQAFRPIIDQSLSQAGATQSFNKVSKMVSDTGGGGLNSSLGGFAGNSGMMGMGMPQNFNFTDYALEKALDGLFKYIGKEEAAIRSNPAARTTDLLKQVFGR